MRIIAFGDIHMSLGAFDTIPVADKADLLIITGDITNFGTGHDAQKIIDVVRRVNKKILALPGNLDQPDVGVFLAAEGITLHGRGTFLDGVGLFGVGGSNPTPFKTPTEFSEDTLLELLERGYQEVRQAESLILVSHAPPFATKADRISNGAHVGSRAVRQFIEKKQPDICLTGHIHEARAEDSIGRTRIFNPGMIRDGGWVEVTVSPDGVAASLSLTTSNTTCRD